MPLNFTFDTKYDVTPGEDIKSNKVTIVGNQFAADISIVNGQYSIDGGAYTSEPGKIGLNQTLTIQHKSAATLSTATTTTVTIKGDSHTYTTTFTSITSNLLIFTDKNNQPTDTDVASNILAIPNGYPAFAPVSIENGQYSINGGNYTDTAGTISPGQTLQLKQTTATTPSTRKVTTLMVGDNRFTFTTITQLNMATTTAKDTTGNISVKIANDVTEDPTSFAVYAEMTNSDTVDVSVTVSVVAASNGKAFVKLTNTFTIKPSATPVTNSIGTVNGWPLGTTLSFVNATVTRK